jgi:hypothetical protein
MTLKSNQSNKARGRRLGGYRGGPSPDGHLGGAKRRAKADAFEARVAPTLTEMQQRSLSLHRMAEELSAWSISVPRGGAWTATAVSRVPARVAASQPTLSGRPLHAGSRLGRGI